MRRPVLNPAGKAVAELPLARAYLSSTCRWAGRLIVGEGPLIAVGFEPFWPHIAGWWSVRRLPNVLLLHYAHLKANLSGEIRRIADFLEIELDETKLLTVVEHCTFDYVRGNVAPANSFVFNKGVNGRWKDILSPSEVALCDEVAARNLPPECAHWLATGELVE
jgi:aryl sulfotransferase